MTIYLAVIPGYHDDPDSLLVFSSVASAIHHLAQKKWPLDYQVIPCELDTGKEIWDDEPLKLHDEIQAMRASLGLSPAEPWKVYFERSERERMRRNTENQK